MSAAAPRGRVLVVSGPGGVGKGTVVAALRQRHPDVAVSVSATTRARRDGEQDGVHYHFMDRADFESLAAEGGFLEHAEFNGNLYGTPWSSLAAPAADGRPVVLEIDVQGARQIRRRAADVGDLDAVLVFIEPPSWGELEARLRGRGSEDEASIEARLRIGREEMAAREEFDHTITNTTVDAAVDALARILADHRTT